MGPNVFLSRYCIFETCHPNKAILHKLSKKDALIYIYIYKYNLMKYIMQLFSADAAVFLFISKVEKTALESS